MTNAMRWLVLACAVAGAACGGSSGDADTSVTNDGFCEDFLEHCPDSKLERDVCTGQCLHGVKPTKAGEYGSICWKVYCATEIDKCQAAGEILTTDPDVRDCAEAHGWFLGE